MMICCGCVAATDLLSTLCTTVGLLDTMILCVCGVAVAVAGARKGDCAFGATFCAET